jgi:hypothetical protein
MVGVMAYSHEVAVLAEEPVMKTSNGIVWGSAINLARNETLVWG